jgi:hypothetical protein
MHEHSIHFFSSVYFFFYTSKRLPSAFCSAIRSFCHVNQLIFGSDAEGDGKDIIFFAACSGLFLPLVHLSVYPAVMQAHSNLFTVCH